MPNVLITGVSDGIGLALAELYLSSGWRVYGLSRQVPKTLQDHPCFYFRACDLSEVDEKSLWFEGKFAELRDQGIDVVYLNAGVSGGAPLPSKELSQTVLDRTLKINVLSSKYLLDAVMALPRKPETVCVSASIAGLRFRAGMLAYSLSKSALLALSGIYAQEYPEVFFAVLGMCNVATKLSDSIVNSERIHEFPEHVKLKQRFSEPGYVVSASQRAQDIYHIIHNKRDAWLKSGEFMEVRSLLTNQSCSPPILENC